MYSIVNTNRKTSVCTTYTQFYCYINLICTSFIILLYLMRRYYEYVRVSCEWCGASMQASNRIELALLSLRYLTTFRTYFSAVICKATQYMTLHECVSNVHTIRSCGNMIEYTNYIKLQLLASNCTAITLIKIIILRITLHLTVHSIEKFLHHIHSMPKHERIWKI